jgi:hypothetical protein
MAVTTQRYAQYDKMSIQTMRQKVTPIDELHSKEIKKSGAMAD